MNNGLSLHAGLAAAALAVAAAGCAHAEVRAAETAEASGLGLPMLDCRYGSPVQAGLVLCKTEPGALIKRDGAPAARADADGWATLGIGRDASGGFEVRAETPGGRSEPVRVMIEPRAFEEGVVPGLDCDFVSPPRDAEIQARIARERVTKQAVFAAFADGVGPRNGFQLPGEGAQTSPYGSKRTKTGVSKSTGETCETTSVHWGLDLRAATGSPVLAPAAGLVTLAEPLYFEGGAVFIDHGHGLVSVFMHMESIDVAVGQQVEPGDRLGGAGMTGSANGPHIHWGLKWRNTEAADRGGDLYIDPSVALAISASLRDSAAAASAGSGAR